MLQKPIVTVVILLIDVLPRVDWDRHYTATGRWAQYIPSTGLTLCPLPKDFENLVIDLGHYLFLAQLLNMSYDCGVL